MRRFKKLSAIILSTMVLTTAFIGCSGKNEKGTNSNKTIKVFIPGYTDPGFKDGYDHNLDEFKKAHPDITIDLIGTGWDQFDKMMGMIQGGDSPDVMIMGSRRLKQLSNMKAIEPLDQYIKNDKKDQYIESVYSTGDVDGVQYGLPIGFSSRALYYRKDLIKQPPKNWSELVEIAKKVEAENPDMKGYAIPGKNTDSTVHQLNNFFIQNNASMYDEKGNATINSKAGVEALQFYTDLYKKYDIVKNPVDVQRGDFANMFKNGQIAMFVSGPWEKNSMGIEPDNEKTPYGVALIPEGKQYGETLVTDSITISATSKNKDAAWTFVDFMSSPERQNEFDETVGFFPIFKSEVDQSRYQSEFLKPFVEMIKYGKPEPKPPIWEDFQNIVIKALQKSLLGEETPQQALDEAQKQLEANNKK